MVRTKEKAGASSSSQSQGKEQTKRRRLTQVGDPGSEEDAPLRGPKPEWTSDSLLEQPDEWREELFHDQMNKLQQRKEAFTCEKEIREVDFGPFGITDKFKALGWEAAFKCYDNEVKKMYDDRIQEWMATLECPPFKAPNKMKLIGWCNGVKVEMSYDFLLRIARFESKYSNEYIYPSVKDLYHEPDKHPNWQHMLDYLFLSGTTHGKLFRKNLRTEAKLLLVLCTRNVIPRRGDKMEVRFQEVPVLYMLMCGKIVPHCRLITTLLKKYGAIGSEEKGSYKRFNPFDIQHLGSGWEYKELERYHKLKTDGRWWRVLKVDARPL
ncbi:hypothetical protein Hanom_Chr07g00651051 [Helianthus anomalus]